MSFVSVDRNVNRSVDIDAHAHEADRQLHRSLELTYRSPHPSNTGPLSRKHAQHASRSSLESDVPSEISGQFDDAEEDFESESEYKSPRPHPASVNGSHSSHSAKRRRSNDWPQQQSADNEREREREHHITSSRQRWPFHHSNGRRTASPRSPRHALPGRRSRFVEGHMNDTVSEKPPSIYLRDDAGAENNRSNSRQSGIFRFGKAIASAFNPFGGWGSVSDIWKTSHEGNRGQDPTNDRLRQAEEAYEELKRSGYQGTIKGSHMQGLRGGADADAYAYGALPGQTWRAIQEKMEYGSGSGPCHSRQSSGNGSSNESAIAGSLRSSFPDLRKAKSSLGIPSVKKSDGTSSLLSHVDGRGQDVRHQKSRKDLQRQAKLLKRVSDLEDKLERARRELRELTGDDEVCMASMAYGYRPFQRKFIPGALPSLPSERLLQDPLPTSESTALLSPLAEDAAQQGNQTAALPQPAENKTPRKTPKKPWRKTSQPESQSRPASSHSPSRKRKSPDPESRKSDSASHQKPQTPSHPRTQEDPAQTPAEADPEKQADTTKTPTRKAKFPKTARGDSPGSVERKQQKQRQSPAAAESTSSPVEEREQGSRALRSSNARNRSVTPVLRMRRGRADLRSASHASSSPKVVISDSHAHGLDENKENSHHGGSQQENENENENNVNSNGNDKQQQQTDEPGQTTPTPRSTRRKVRYEYIPPVPPLPKNLAATAAKADRRLAKEMSKKRASRGNVKERVNEAEAFQWPEDIF